MSQATSTLLVFATSDPELIEALQSLSDGRKDLKTRKGVCSSSTLQELGHALPKEFQQWVAHLGDASAMLHVSVQRPPKPAPKPKVKAPDRRAKKRAPSRIPSTVLLSESEQKARLAQRPARTELARSIYRMLYGHDAPEGVSVSSVHALVECLQCTPAHARYLIYGMCDMNEQEKELIAARIGPDRALDLAAFSAPNQATY